MTGAREAPSRVGLLYPTRDSGEDDFLHLAERFEPPLSLEVVYFPWPEDVIDLAAMDTNAVMGALERLGSDEHLRTTLPTALEGRCVDAVAFAVTSSSFLHGRDGVARQLRTLTDVCGVPATSTTAGFQAAVRHLGYRKVGLASVYHAAASDHFVRRIEESGATVVSRVDAAAGSDRELASWTPDRIVDLVGRTCHPDAQAILLPETALHASALTPELEAAAGCPVLTATQVTLWSAARLLGVEPTTADAGPLYA